MFLQLRYGEGRADNREYNKLKSEWRCNSYEVYPWIEM